MRFREKKLLNNNQKQICKVLTYQNNPKKH